MIAWLSFEFVPQSSFRDGFLGNLFATIIGVIVGIPIALELNRVQQERQIRDKQESEKKEKSQHKSRLLTLIKNELDYNRQLLVQLIEQQDDSPKIVAYLGLKNDLWNSFSDSGELQWIDDLELLDSISTAYYHIRNIIPSEEKYFDPDFNNAVSVGNRRTYAGEKTVERVISIRPDTLESIKHALTKIEEHLIEINTGPH